VAGCCVVGNELSVSIKFKEILDWLAAIFFSGITLLDRFRFFTSICKIRLIQL
jgi:hypothetical protein